MTSTDAIKSLVKELHGKGIDVYLADVHAPVLEHGRKTGCLNPSAKIMCFRPWILQYVLSVTVERSIIINKEHENETNIIQGCLTAFVVEIAESNTRRLKAEGRLK